MPGVRRSADKLPVKLDAVEKKRMASADELAKLLELEPHPSGCTGWFRQTFADPMSVNTPGGKRAASTAIYFLQKKGMRSAFHRQRSSEVRSMDGFILLRCSTTTLGRPLPCIGLTTAAR